MEIPKIVKQLADADGFPDVKYLGKWGDFDVYSAYNKDFPYIGLPQFILSSESSIEWATLEQTQQLMELRF